ncbi:7862_t:CDS:2, partial [Gigaspora margarita]
NISKDIVAISAPKSELEQKLEFYRNKAAVPNTVKATQNWMKKFDEFQQYYNYTTPIESIEDPCLIEKQICEFIAQMTKKDRGEYKAKTVKQAIDTLNRYINKNGIIRGLNLYDKYQFPDLHNVLNDKMKDLQEKGLGEQKGSMALTVHQFQVQSDESILFYRYHSKNNQRGIEGENAH